MSFCDDSFSFLELLGEFKEIYEKYDRLDELQPINAIGLAFEINEEIDNFKDRLAMMGIKTVICAVLENVDIDKYATQIDDIFNEIFSTLEELLNNEPSPDSYNEINLFENELMSKIENFENLKKTLEESLKEILKQLFEPLKLLGATDEDINFALDGVDISENPTEMLTNIFKDVALNSINTLN
jgi:hypothetical protein